MLNVAIICNEMGGRGSVANVALQQALQLSKYFSVKLVSNSFSEDCRSFSNVDLLTLKAPNFYQLRRFAHVPNEIAFLWCARRKLIEAISKHNIDVLICHSHASVVYVGRYLQRKFNTKVILIMHGDIFDRPSGTYDSRLTSFYKFVTPRAYRSANHVVALSPYMKEKALERGATEQNTVVIPNGIFPQEIGLEDDFSYSSPQDDPECLKLLYVGRLSVEKNVQMLISACSKLIKEKIKFHLKLIGDGPLKPKLQEQVSKKGVTQQVTFCGVISRAELSQYYLWSDLVCITSRSDPLPTTVLEAMICGRPVVGTKTGGIEYMIDNGKTGYLVEVDAVQALYECLKEISNNKEKLEVMGRNARKIVNEKYNWTTNAKGIKSLIEQMVS